MVSHAKLVGKGMVASTGTYPFFYLGTVFCISRSHGASQVPKGAVMVIRDFGEPPRYSSFNVHAMKRTGAILTERGKVASPPMVWVREMKKPAILGIRGVLSLLKTGDEVLMDTIKGFVYKV